MMRDDLYDRTRGKWRQIMMALGMGFQFLNSKKNGPCPMCGGTDRWRFTDHDGPDGESGGWWCNNCGHGYGVSLVMTWKSLTKASEAKALIESVIGGPPMALKRPPSRMAPPDISKQKAKMAALWAKGMALDGHDLASRYLWHARGMRVADVPPGALRFVLDEPYWGKEKGEVLGYYGCMLARFIAPDNSGATLQRLWLEEPGEKAEVPVPRANLPGPVPSGGAVRLGEAAEAMGVAEGVESALGASLMAPVSLHLTVPVWACLTAGALLKFEPPPECKRLYIFADYDPNHTGEAAASALAHRLEMRKPNPVWTEVHCAKGPGGEHTKFDWADAWGYYQFHKRGGKIRFR